MDNIITINGREYNHNPQRGVITRWREDGSVIEIPTDHPSVAHHFTAGK